MVKRALRAARDFGRLEASKWRHRAAYTALHDNLDPDVHVREAAGWLKRAQDCGADRGVSYGTRFGEGFLESYPETTGYIIPTFLRLAREEGDDELGRRAVEMGDWEISIQMANGAIMGGRVNPNPTPAVFNTGQVLLGWAALGAVKGGERFLEAGRRAADWLVAVQEPEGSWREGNSSFAKRDATVYNVKAAWGLCLLGQVAGEQRYVDAAVRNAEFALGRQTETGWFRDCCLTDPARPLLHTLAYTMQGLLEIGRLTGRQDFADAARRTADALSAVVTDDGFLPGRFLPDFSGAVRWCCLTGSAQTSIVWSCLARDTGERSYSDAAARVNRYLMARHDISSPDPAIRGGVAGSWPVHGEYGQFMVLNWATKFFIDALLEGRAAGVPTS